MTTTDPFTDAARAEAEEYTPTDEEVRTDYVMAYADRDSSQLLAGMAFDRWLTKRDQIIRRQERYIEELESGRITPSDHLAAQEPTDAEVEAAAQALDPDAWGRDSDGESQREHARDGARAALSAARAARRDEENNEKETNR